MANMVFNKGLTQWRAPATAPGVGDWEWILERSTSTWTPDKDNESLLDMSGFVEIDVASYARVDLAGYSAAENDTTDLLAEDCNDVSFGTLESGQTVKSIILARNDSSNYVPFLRIDTDNGGLLPRALGGGTFTVQISTTGLVTIAQA